MGRRLRTMWRLHQAIDGQTGDGGRQGAPAVIVAPVRALVQRLGPHVGDVEPIVVGREDRSTSRPRGRPGRRRATAARTWWSTAVRWPCAGSIMDVFPSTADIPVRIDLWGDEVDRLTEFSVNDQRSTVDLDEVEIFPVPRAARRPTRCAERAEALVATEPWGREQWERLANGLVFDGMESWLPWLTDGEQVLLDLLGSSAQVLLVEPRRMRDRAADILAEEADLAATLAGHVGATSADGELRVPAAPPRLRPVARPHDRTGMDGDDRRPRVRTWPTVGGQRLGATVVGDGARARQAAARSAARRATGWCWPRTERARPPGCADRCSPIEGIDLAPDGRVDQPRRPCRRRPRRPWLRVRASVKLAVLCRGRRDRPASRASAGPSASARAQGFFDDLEGRRLRRAPPARRRPLRRHGQARDRRGRARLPAARVPRRRPALRARPTRSTRSAHYTGGESPTLSRMGGGDSAEGEGAGPARRCAEIAQELVVLYQTRVHDAGPHVRARHAVAARARGRVPLRRDARPAQRDRRRQGATWSAPRRWTGSCAATSASARPRWRMRAAFKAVQDGKQVAVLVPTTVLAQQHFNDLRRPLRRLSRPASRCSAASANAQSSARSSTGLATARSTSSSAPTGCCRTT